MCEPIEGAGVQGGQGASDQVEDQDAYPTLHAFRVNFRDRNTKPGF